MNILSPENYLLYSSYPRCAWAATGIVVGWFVCLCVTCESTHLDAIALRLHNKLLVLIVADFDSLSNKSEQKLRSLNLHVGSLGPRPIFFYRTKLT